MRGALLLLPIAATAGLWVWRRPSRSLAAGALLAMTWNVVSLLAVNIAAVRWGWWRYEFVGGSAFGVPVDVLLGWALVWSAVPLLALRGRHLPAAVAAALLLDVVVMPHLAPLVALGPQWLTGEVVMLAVCLVPGLLLGSWTTTATALPGRAALQVALAGALVGWLIPAAALEQPAGVGALLRQPLTGSMLLVALAVALVSLLGLAAVQEFATVGRGTPVPYDPPQHLVRTGPYAYCRNPMQTSVTLVFFILAAAAGSARLALAGVLALAYGLGLAAWHENQELRERFGDSWLAHRAGVAAWRVRLRPAAGGPRATVWIGQSCAQCTPFAGFLLRRTPTRLEVRAGETYPGPPLTRVTYEVDGRQWHGVAAFARCLEHLHVGWAVVGWAVRLPGVVHAIAVAVDASGGGPRLLPGAADGRQPLPPAA